MKGGYGRMRKRALCAALAVLVTVFPNVRAFADGPGVSLYDAVSVEGSVSLNAELLAGVRGPESATEAVSRQARSMSDAQKRNPADVNQATLFAEAALAAASKKGSEGPYILLSKGTLEDLADQAANVRERVSQSLTESGVAVTRKLANVVTVETALSAFTLAIHPNILETSAEKIRVTKTTDPGFSITIRPADLKADFFPALAPDAQTSGTEHPESETPSPAPDNAANAEPRILEISVTMDSSECEPGSDVPIPKVHVTVPDGQLSAPITLSLNPGSREPSALTMEGVAGQFAPAKYNPASRTLDASLDASDVYTFGKRNVFFTDLAQKDRKIRAAVEALARVNVVYGYSDNTFRPEQPVTRAEFVAFVMRAMGRVNNSLKSPFLDVTEGHGCFHEIASAYYYGVIKGYDENHFCGERFISKTQIYAILGRILQREMGYVEIENASEYLAQEFGDEIDEWARSDIAIATREGLVIRQSNGEFNGNLFMNRGDVALIIYGLYQRLA